MNKLSKTKSFSVSSETIEVDFKGTICECANLLKSGIKNQNIVLVAYDNKWHEIDISDLRISDEIFLENSHLGLFENYVLVNNISLVDLGITSEINLNKGVSSVLSHNDYVMLAEKFHPHDYIKIAKLDDYNLANGYKSSIYELTSWLNVCQRDKISIDELISNREIEKSKIIMKPEKIEKLEIGTDGQTAIQVEKIEVIDAVVLTGTDNAPITATPVKKTVSVQVFENFTPERISELVGLKEKQLQIVKENPVVKTITDKTSYELAKKTAAILLKASTAIDGKEGVDALGVRCINAFKKMFSSETRVIAKISRDPYDEQKTIISSWENAELLREQAEQRLKLEKIKKRTDELFAVPFTFNGSVYSIGTIYCMPSLIESASDEDFKVIVDNGKAIKQSLDTEAELQAGKDKEIADLKAKLAAFEALQNMSNTEPIKVTANISNENTVSNIPASIPNSVGPQSGSVNQNNSATTNQTVKEPVAYVMPPQENVLLNALDLEHLEHIEKPAYIKCRGYYVRALKEVGVLLSEIMSNPDVTIKKAPKIVELSEILKKSI
jgi:hypothetical protein